jgi:hypothetical protein
MSPGRPKIVDELLFHTLPKQIKEIHRRGSDPDAEDRPCPKAN